MGHHAKLLRAATSWSTNERREEASIDVCPGAETQNWDRSLPRSFYPPTSLSTPLSAPLMAVTAGFFAEGSLVMPAETADASTHAIFSADDLKRLRRAPRSQSRRHNRFGRISRRRARRSFFFRRAHRLLWCMGGLRAPRGHQGHALCHAQGHGAGGGSPTCQVSGKPTLLPPPAEALGTAGGCTALDPAMAADLRTIAGGPSKQGVSLLLSATAAVQLLQRRLASAAVDALRDDRAAEQRVLRLEHGARRAGHGRSARRCVRGRRRASGAAGCARAWCPVECVGVAACPVSPSAEACASQSSPPCACA